MITVQFVHLAAKSMMIIINCYLIIFTDYNVVRISDSERKNDAKRLLW